jgi:hypothetical protein
MAISPKDKSDYFPYRASHYNGQTGGEIAGPGIPEDKPLKWHEMAGALSHQMNMAFWQGFQAARQRYEKKPARRKKT